MRRAIFRVVYKRRGVASALALPCPKFHTHNACVDISSVTRSSPPYVNPCRGERLKHDHRGCPPSNGGPFIDRGSARVPQAWLPRCLIPRLPPTTQNESSIGHFGDNGLSIMTRGGLCTALSRGRLDLGDGRPNEGSRNSEIPRVVVCLGVLRFFGLAGVPVPVGRFAGTELELLLGSYEGTPGG